MINTSQTRQRNSATRPVTASAHRPARQHGAALIVGLILLMILTVLGISGMSTSILEVAMTTNAKQKLYAFQATESAVDAAIASNDPITVDDTTVTGSLVRDVIQYEIKDDNGVVAARANADTSFRTFADGAPGGGWEAGTMSAVHFRVDANTDTSIRGARSQQQAGFFIMAPTP